MVWVFYWILNMTILGSILAVILMGLRRIKKIPRIFIYAMYSLVFFRLICPVGLTNGFSLLNLLPKGSVRLVYLEGKELDTSTTALSLTNFMQSADSYQPFTLKSDGLTTFYKIGSIVWAIVGGVLLVGYCIMYFIAMKEIRKSIHIRENIYQSHSINVPMVVGIIKPRIILPEITIEDGHLSHMIAHEKVHIKHRDNLWRLFAIFICCLHWFNPFVWITLKYFFIDMELACDEQTLHKYNTKQRSEYADALLVFTKVEPIIYAPSFGGGNIKIRIHRVLNYRSFSTIALIMFSCLFMLIAILALSNK